MIINPKILIIDDIQDNIYAIKTLLEKNFSSSMILTALNGDVGIELAKSTRPDVILLDSFMPIKDGYLVCEELKGNVDTQDIPIIFVTALKEEIELKIKALNVGVEGFLTKPIDEPTLIATVSAMLRLREADRYRSNENKRLEEQVYLKTISLKKELNERLESEMKLRDSENRYIALLDNLDSGVVVHDANTMIISANQRAVELFGIGVAKVIVGKFPRDLYLTLLDENYKELEHSESAVNIILRTQKPLKNYVMGITIKNHTNLKWLKCDGFPRFNVDGSLEEIVISFRDITAKLINEKKEQELIITNKKLDLISSRNLADLKKVGSIFENSVKYAPIPIMIHAEDGTVLNISQSWTRLTNYKISDIPTIFDWTEKAYGQKKDEVIDFINQLYHLTEIQHDGEFVVTTKDGRKLTWDFNSGYIGDLPDGRAVAMSVATDVTERLLREEKIIYLSFHDLLTGLYNRRFFEEEMIRLDNPRNYPITVVMGDVNGLKLVNDAFGHTEGDHLLKEVGRFLKDGCRANDVVCRWGGDEFVLLLPNTSNEEATILLERIKNITANASYKFGHISVSFGYETKVESSQSLKKIFLEAEELMYINKIDTVNSVRTETIKTILNTLFEKSSAIKLHTERVSKYAEMIAVAMRLPKAKVIDIKTIGNLHDIGKIVIDLSILDKPGKLTKNEYEIIKQHPVSGAKMLASSHEYNRLSFGVLHHHERYDGKGYPNQLTGENIPLESRIISVADAYDAMTSERSYKNRLTKAEAIAELIEYSGTQFDKIVVEAFVTSVVNHI